MSERIEISGFDERGRGVGNELSVRFAYPGDLIEAEVTSRKKKFAKLISLIKPSSNRQTPPCKHFGVCGGCPWQGIKYESQLKFKEGIVEELFYNCEPIIPSPEEYFYRNRMDFAFGPDYSIGLKDDKDNIINIEKCWLMSESSNSIISRIRQFISFKKLKNHRDGIMRHVVIREGRNNKNTVVNIITSDKGEFPLEDLWEELNDEVSGISWSINLSPADRSYGEIQKTFGQDHLIESLNGIKFKVPVQSFFQTNTLQAEKLLKIIEDFADLKGEESILDLYAGTGSIGLSLARKAKKVFGIEENAPAVELSRSNAELNGISNFSAVAGRVEDLLGELSNEHEVVILDPPRPGVNKKILKKLGETRPEKIIYVSCNPYTQKHDVQILKEYGYKVKRCQPIDMFPHTPHIENVISLGALS